MLPSAGPFHENEEGLPLSSTSRTRQDTNSGESLKTMIVTDLGLGSEPRSLLEMSIFHVPTPECFCWPDALAPIRAMQARTAMTILLMTKSSSVFVGIVTQNRTAN